MEKLKTSAYLHQPSHFYIETIFPKIICHAATEYRYVFKLNQLTFEHNLQNNTLQFTQVLFAILEQAFSLQNLNFLPPGNTLG